MWLDLWLTALPSVVADQARRRTPVTNKPCLVITMDIGLTTSTTTGIMLRLNLRLKLTWGIQTNCFTVCWTHFLRSAKGVLLMEFLAKFMTLGGIEAWLYRGYIAGLSRDVRSRNTVTALLFVTQFLWERNDVKLPEKFMLGIVPVCMQRLTAWVYCTDHCLSDCQRSCEHSYFNYMRGMVLICLTQSIRGMFWVFSISDMKIFWE